ncbi:MAG: PQQ-binding-like beta-propeller repeat protein [Phycisphaerales bacterium]|nr:PQQ-binding-like beta-propeller repeat protein [Phycisphaerales bacterium]
MRTGASEVRGLTGMIRSGWPRPLAAVCLALAVGFTGCAGNGSSGGDHGTSVDGEVALPRDAYTRMGYRLEWSSRTVTGRGAQVEFAEAYPDYLLTQDEGNTVALLETSDGGVRWSADLAGDLERFVGLDRFLVGGVQRVMASSESEIYLLDEKTGDLRDRQRLRELVNTRPLVTPSGLVIFGCPTSVVTCQDLLRRTRMWAYGVRGAVDARPALLGGGVVGVVSQGGDVLFLDSVSGSGRGLTRIYGGLANDPVTDGSTLYVASLDQSIWAIEPYGADKVRWRIRTESPLTAQPQVFEDTLYITIPGEGMTAVDTATGVKRWSNPDVDGDVVAIRAGRPLVWNGRDVVLLDPRQGREIDRAALEDVDMIRADRMVDGNLFTLSASGTVKKYSPR